MTIELSDEMLDCIIQMRANNPINRICLCVMDEEAPSDHEARMVCIVQKVLEVN